MQSLTEVLGTSAIIVMASITLPSREASAANRSHDVQHSKLIAADHMMCHGVAGEPGGVEKERDGCRSRVQSSTVVEKCMDATGRFKTAVRG